MKKIMVISLSFLLSFISLLQSEAQNLTKQQKETIKIEVEDIFKNMLESAEKLDYDQLSLGVVDTHHAGFITNGTYYSQYSSLIDDMKSNAQGLDHQNITIKDQKTTVLSDNIVLMTVTGVSMVELSDSRTITVNFLWSFIYEKIDNKWKVIHLHQSRSK